MSAGSPGALGERIAAVVAIDAGRPAIEFEGRWHTWGELRAGIDAVADLVPEPGAQIGIVLRNTPGHVAALLGVLVAGGTVVTINPHRGVERTRSDISELPLDLVVGTGSDLADVLPGGISCMEIDPRGPAVPPVVGLADERSPGTVPRTPEVAVRMLTSGTTGPPKRVDLGHDTLERVLIDAKHYEKDKGREFRLRDGIAIVNSPLVHLGGLFRVLQCVGDGRSFCMLERFGVQEWCDAVRRHRPRTASLVPAALRMVLEADPDPADLSSLRTVVSGTAPLDPDDADEFRQRFGVAVLVSYAATEFGGSVAGWNLADHERHWADKRGSVGRVHPGCEIRVVDQDSGEVLSADAEGLLEVKASQLGALEWVRTTDLAVLDADGFLWIRGRADQAIIRGGFKVQPETVRAALERHPDVRGAAVVGKADPRLGAVPVAAVELRAGAGVDSAALIAHAAESLAPYEVPVAVFVMDELPRTAPGKVDLAAVRAAVDLKLPQTDLSATTPAGSMPTSENRATTNSK